MNREERIEALENFLSFNTVVNDWLTQDQIHRVAEQIIDEGWHTQSDDERIERLPKKAKISIHGTTDWNTRCRCPVCDKDLFDSQKYCSECGQKIDWGKGKEQT